MNWLIPRISGETDDPIQIDLSPGRCVFVVGANGAGKSALFQQLVVVADKQCRVIRRLSAHRRNWLPSGTVEISPSSREKYEKDRLYWENKQESQWIEQYPGKGLSSILFDLLDKDSLHARSIRDVVKYGACSEVKELESSPFDKINELLAQGNLEVSIHPVAGGSIVAQPTDSGIEPYSIAQMSDGERNAVILAATVLTVEPGTIVVIDEPERHLHRRIIVPLLSAMFQERQDCVFVVGTHEVELPMTHPEADVLAVRSCKWSGNTPKAWDITLIGESEGLPGDVKRAILGNRRKILFVEGGANSLDVGLYSVLFPDVYVEPVGNCREVEYAVRGLEKSPGHHHIKTFGLIDHDGRPQEQIEALAGKRIYALEVQMVESLYYCSDAITAVAERQAESYGLSASTLIEAAKEAVLEILTQGKTTQIMAARQSVHEARHLIRSQLPGWRSFLSRPDDKVSISAASPYPAELKRLNELLEHGQLDDIVARYPLKHLGNRKVFTAIANAVKCNTAEDYERLVVARAKSTDTDLAEKLKQRIGPLSDAIASG